MMKIDMFSFFVGCMFGCGITFVALFVNFILQIC